MQNLSKKLQLKFGKNVVLILFPNSRFHFFLAPEYHIIEKPYDCPCSTNYSQYTRNEIIPFRCFLTNCNSKWAEIVTEFRRRGFIFVIRRDSVLCRHFVECV